MLRTGLPMPTLNIAAIIVTYNRRRLLAECLSAIGAQTRKLDCVIIVDNASTDGTSGWLTEWLPANLPQARLLTLDANTGGAGGFSTGLEAAIQANCDWIWMMDDDAKPHPSALEELMLVATDPRNVYGSIATNGQATSWTTTLTGPPSRAANKVSEIPDVAEVQSLPFLGFMIHRNLVRTIGLPDAGYFIAADDVEYCVRASRAGARIIISGKSRIEHPTTQRYSVRVFGSDVTYLRLPPWKRYYDTRNRLLIARKYYGLQLLTQTIPGSFVRLFVALRYEPRKLAQLWAFSTGMLDGLLGIKGRRHAKWGIRQ